MRFPYNDIVNITAGFARIAIEQEQVNTYVAITDENIMEGVLPQYPRLTIYTIYATSSTVNYNARLIKDSASIIIYTDIAQDYVIKWYTLFI